MAYFINMRTSYLLFILSSALPALSIPLTETNDFHFQPMSWTGPVHPGGENVSLVGSIKSIYDQVLALNPNFETDFPADEDDTTAPSKDLEAPTIKPREDPPLWIEPGDPKFSNGLKVICDDNPYPYHDFGSGYYIYKGLDYLDAIGVGLCGAGGDYAHTSRISCDEKSAIWMQHNDINKVQLPCKYVAKYARAVLQNCLLEGDDKVQGFIDGLGDVDDSLTFRVLIGGVAQFGDGQQC